jgi:hypothetical protein
LSSRRVFKSTLQSGSTKFSNLVIEKTPVNSSNQEGQMPTLQSRSTKFSNLVIEKNQVNFSHQEGQMSTLQSGRTDVSLVKSQK